MTSKLVVNTIEADTGISSVSFASSISLSSTSVFHLGDAGLNIGADTNISRAGNGILAFNINSSEKVRIDSSGNLGLGIASPVARLHVHNAGTGSGDHAYAYFTTGDTGSDASSGFTIGVAANQVATVNYREAGSLTFATSATERLRIDSSGRLLLAATSGTHRFHIKGNGGDGIKIENSGGTNAAVIDLKNTLTNYVKEYRIAVAGSDGAYGTASSLFVRDQTAGQNRFEVQSGGNVKVSTGNLIIGTAGRGIDYSAQTATSASGASTTNEILVHYEEGTWTPTLENAGSTTYSVQVGKFTRIGNIVFITGVIFINNHDNSATQTTGFLGLPYSNGLGRTQVFHVAGNENWDTNLGDSNLTGWMTSGNPDRIRIYHNSGHNLQTVSVNDIGDNGELFVTGHYFVS